MSENFISKVSKTIISGSNSEASLKELEFARTQILDILKTENTRKKQIEDEISLNKDENLFLEEVTERFFLEENLKIIKKNISNLENFMEILNTKKMILEIKSKETVTGLVKNLSLKNSFLYN